MSLQPSEGVRSSGAGAETSLRSRAVPHSLNKDTTALGTVTRASRDRDCQTSLQGLGACEARPGSQVRGLWSPRFPGIPAGCFWQRPRNEASPAALCLAPDGCAQAAPCLCSLWAQRDRGCRARGWTTRRVVLSLTVSADSTVL